eukprot:scaffold3143_cov104-Isochrysis_galbana.AAC.11
MPCIVRDVRHASRRRDLDTDSSMDGQHWLTLSGALILSGALVGPRVPAVFSRQSGAAATRATPTLTHPHRLRGGHESRAVVLPPRPDVDHVPLPAEPARPARHVHVGLGGVGQHHQHHQVERRQVEAPHRRLVRNNDPRPSRCDGTGQRTHPAPAATRFTAAAVGAVLARARTAHAAFAQRGTEPKGRAWRIPAKGWLCSGTAHPARRVLAGTSHCPAKNSPRGQLVSRWWLCNLLQPRDRRSRTGGKHRSVRRLPRRGTLACRLAPGSPARRVGSTLVLRWQPERRRRGRRHIIQRPGTRDPCTAELLERVVAIDLVLHQQKSRRRTTARLAAQHRRRRRRLVALAAEQHAVRDAAGHRHPQNASAHTVALARGGRLGSTRRRQMAR